MVSSGLRYKYSARFKLLVRAKHSSLLWQTVVDEGRKVYCHRHKFFSSLFQPLSLPLFKIVLRWMRHCAMVRALMLQEMSAQS
jgi:hypothetical protein